MLRKPSYLVGLRPRDEHVASRLNNVNVVQHLRHVPALDGLRGVAILVVVGWHAGYVLPGGQLGVDLFFSLSGFLITSLLLTEWSNRGAISLPSFYLRRGVRLLPALVLMLATFLAVFAVASPGRLNEAAVGAGLGLTYVTNLVVGFEGSLPEPAFLHLWSLAQEEQFYLIWPIVLVVALRRSVSPYVVLCGLGLLALGISARQVQLADSMGDGWAYMPDVRGGCLVVGCMAGIVYSYGMISRVPRFLAGAAALVAAFLIIEPHGSFPLIGIPTTVMFTVAAPIVILACVLKSDWWLARVFGLRPLRYLGLISYGLYLWHYPLIPLFGWRLGLPLAVAIAVLSWRYLEQPLLRANRRRRFDSDRSVSPRQSDAKWANSGRGELLAPALMEARSSA